MPTFEFEVKVTVQGADVPFTRFPFVVSAKDEPRAQMKLESYIHELQSRLEREANLSQQPISGIVAHQTATRTILATLKGRRALEEVDSRLTMTDLVILGTAYSVPVSPDTVLQAITSRPETPFYTPVGLATRVSRLASMQLVELKR